MEVCGAAFESLSEMEPRPSTTGAQIDNRGVLRGIKSALKQRGGGSVRLRDIETVLKRIHDVISKECWKPRLLVEFDELYAMHINPAGRRDGAPANSRRVPGFSQRRRAQRHPAAKSAADRQYTFRHLNPDCEIPGSGRLVPGAIHRSIRAGVAVLS